MKKRKISRKVLRKIRKRIRKIIIKGIRSSVFSLEFSGSIVNGLIPFQAIGLPIPLEAPPTIRYTNADLSKQAPIAQALEQISVETDLTPQEIHKLYQLSIEYTNNTLSEEELITHITNLRGGSFVDVVAVLGIIAGLVIMIRNEWGLAFQPKTNMVTPHLQGLYGNSRHPHQFGYGTSPVGPRSITVTGFTKNAGSEKKRPSGSWDYNNYKEIMRELDQQTAKKLINIQVGDQSYILKNPDRDDAYDLGLQLANSMYDSIIQTDTDICDIAQNLGFRADNIKKVKDHIFYNTHTLDRYGPTDTTQAQFDPDLQRALAWKRLETGIHSQDDITWIKHELAERHHELKFKSGYNEAHNRAQTRFDGAPWEDDF